MKTKQDLEILMDILAKEINKYDGKDKTEEKVTRMVQAYFAYQKDYEKLTGAEYKCPEARGRTIH
jgi:hypothetical protein